MIIHCAVCENPRQVTPYQFKQGAKYCSAECSRVGSIKRVQVHCQTCDIEFTAWPSELKRGQGKYCSDACRDKALTNKVTIQCKICDNLFEVVPARLKANAKYCSWECYRKDPTGGPGYIDGRTSLPGYFSRLRRSKLHKAEGSYSLQEWQDLLAKHGGKCTYCGSAEDITADHIIPLAKGGSNFIENIQPLCRSCNSKKGARLP